MGGAPGSGLWHLVCERRRQRPLVRLGHLSAIGDWVDLAKSQPGRSWAGHFPSWAPPHLGKGVLITHPLPATVRGLRKQQGAQRVLSGPHARDVVARMLPGAMFANGTVAHGLMHSHGEEGGSFPFSLPWKAGCLP